MKTKVNLFTAIFLQMVTMISGLILPRLIIQIFGSDVNGLVSSITQFLNFIALLEGGIGAVVLAALYEPIERGNKERINIVLAQCDYFFKRLSFAFIVYTCILMIVYPIFISKTYSFAYVSTLIFILSLNTLMQYMFSITRRLLLQADQKMYIVNLISSITVILNLVSTIAVLVIWPNIHLAKLISCIVFLIQPISYKAYVRKHYNISSEKRLNHKPIKNQWSGFTQNFAHFINMNTDVVVITIILSLGDVSVYVVYMLALNALRQIITTVTSSYQSNLGKYFASGNHQILKENFDKFSTFIGIVSTSLFTTCLLLINPFVQLYTANITDLNYSRPLFAIVMTLAQFCYCIREPYRLLVLSAGKFRETNFGAIMEAVINIVISVALAFKFGLVGVAVGTLLAIIFRLIYFLVYLKKEVIQLSNMYIVKNCIYMIAAWIINIYIYMRCSLSINTVGKFILYGGIILLVEIVVIILLRTILTKLTDIIVSKKTMKIGGI